METDNIETPDIPWQVLVRAQALAFTHQAMQQGLVSATANHAAFLNEATRVHKWLTKDLEDDQATE